MSTVAIPPDVAPDRATASDRPFWREALVPYAEPRVGRSLVDLDCTHGSGLVRQHPSR